MIEIKVTCEICGKKENAEYNDKNDSDYLSEYILSKFKMGWFDFPSYFRHERRELKLKPIEPISIFTCEKCSDKLREEIRQLHSDFFLNANILIDQLKRKDK